MSAEFVDTNILIYAHDRGAGSKQDKSLELLNRLFQDGAGVLSIQVLSEFFVSATKKLQMEVTEAEAVIRDLGVWTVHRPTHADILRACYLHHRYTIAWWDAMVLNSAIESGCSFLWSEDFSDGQHYQGVTVRNPFKSF